MKTASDEFPRYNTETTWSHRRTWELPKSVITRKVIWPWQMAWRRRMDTAFGNEIICSEDEWITEDEYLVLKLKGEAQ